MDTGLPGQDGLHAQRRAEVVNKNESESVLILPRATVDSSASGQNTRREFVT